MSEIKIGDVVPWSAVPDGAMVREEDGIERGAYSVRIIGCGYVVKRARPNASEWSAYQTCDAWEWGTEDEVDRVTIVALGLSGEETADELKMYADVFEAVSKVANR